jgi:hypothetical protein
MHRGGPTARDDRYATLVGELQQARQRRRDSLTGEWLGGSSSSSTGPAAARGQSPPPLQPLRPAHTSSPPPRGGYYHTPAYSRPAGQWQAVASRGAPQWGGGDHHAPPTYYGVPSPTPEDDTASAVSSRAVPGFVPASARISGWVGAGDSTAAAGGGGAGTAQCSYCGERMAVGALAAHMQTTCPARPGAYVAGDSGGGSGGGSSGAAVMTPQAYRQRAMREVEVWLLSAGLGGFVEAFARAGFDDLPYLLGGATGLGMERGEVAQLVEAVGMAQHPADEKRLREALRRGAQPGGRGGGGGGGGWSNAAQEGGSRHGSSHGGAQRGGEGVGRAGGGEGARRVNAWLETLNLGQYAPRFASAGYDDLDFLLDPERLGEAGVEELVEEMAMPRGHAIRLRRAVRRGVSGLEAALQAGGGGGGGGSGLDIVSSERQWQLQDQAATVEHQPGIGRLRNQLDGASGELSQLAHRWDSLAEDRRSAELEIRAEYHLCDTIVAADGFQIDRDLPKRL